MSVIATDKKYKEVSEMSGNGKNSKKHGPSGMARKEAAKTILQGRTKETTPGGKKKFPNKGPKRKH